MTFVDWILALWKEICFVVVVESWESGIRFRRGNPESEPLGAGIWFFWPFIDRIEVIPRQLRFSVRVDYRANMGITLDGVNRVDCNSY